MRRTVISSRVSVPVLSEQITEVLPSVSTADSRRTSAWRRAMRCTPMRERDRDDRRQRLRDDGDRERDAEDEHVDERLAAQQPEQNDHEHDDERGRASSSPDPVEVLLQRGLPVSTVCEQPGDLAELGLHARWRRPAPGRGRR